MSKYIYSKIAFIFLMIISLLISQFSVVYAEDKNNKSSYSEVSEQANEFYEALKEYSMDQKDKAVKEAKQTLSYLDSRIEKIEDKSIQKWEELNQEGKEQLQRNLKNLRKQRTEVAEWYGGMKQSTDESWDYLKSGFMKSYKVMSDTWHDIEEEYSSNEDN